MCSFGNCSVMPLLALLVLVQISLSRQQDPTWTALMNQAPAISNSVLMRGDLVNKDMSLLPINAQMPTQLSVPHSYGSTSSILRRPGYRHKRAVPRQPHNPPPRSFPPTRTKKGRRPKRPNNRPRQQEQRKRRNKNQRPPGRYQPGRQRNSKGAGRPVGPTKQRPGPEGGPPVGPTKQRPGPEGGRPVRPARQRGPKGGRPVRPTRQRGPEGGRPVPPARQRGPKGGRPAQPTRQRGPEGGRPVPPARQRGPEGGRPVPPARQRGSTGGRPMRPAQQRGSKGGNRNQGSNRPVQQQGSQSWSPPNNRYQQQTGFNYQQTGQARTLPKKAARKPAFKPNILTRKRKTNRRPNRNRATNVDYDNGGGRGGAWGQRQYQSGYQGWSGNQYSETAPGSGWGQDTTTTPASTWQDPTAMSSFFDLFSNWFQPAATPTEPRPVDPPSGPDYSKKHGLCYCYDRSVGCPSDMSTNYYYDECDETQIGCCDD